MVELPISGKIENLVWFQFLAFTALVMLAISSISDLSNTIGLESKYVFVFSLGLLIFSVTEWAQYRGEYQRMGTSLVGPFTVKEEGIIYPLFKSFGIALSIVPFIELILEIRLIPF